MIDRTLFRPREIVQFCTDALMSARDMNSFPIDDVAIGNAEMAYSEARTKDLAAEYRFQYPGLLSLFELFRGRARVFSRDDLELLCLSISTGEYRLDEAARWVRDQEPEFLIDVLWRVGFLRAWSMGGAKLQAGRKGLYLGAHQVATLNLINSERFQIHPMFRAYLGLEEPFGGEQDVDES
jgi:hypothetical protein